MDGYIALPRMYRRGGEMKVPKSFMVAGNTITVRRIKNLEQNTDNVGQYLHKECLIEIDAGLSEQFAYSTWWHEMLECVMEYTGCLVTQVNHDRQFLIRHDHLETMSGYIAQALVTAKY